MLSSIIILLITALLVLEVKSEITVTQIKDSNVYAYQNGFYFGAFVITKKGVIAIDAPPSVNSEKSIATIIGEYTTLPITTVIYSHHHLDHIGAASVFPKHAKYICHKKAAQRIKETPTVPRCTKLVDDDGYKVDGIVDLQYYGQVHSLGNLFIYIKSVKLLMVIDLVFPKWTPFHSWGVAENLHKYYEAHDIILNNYNFDYYIGGHLNYIGDRNDVILNKQYFEDIYNAVNDGLTNVNYNNIVSELGGFTGTNTWTIFKAYQDAIVDYCINIVVGDKKWDTKLFGVNDYIDTLCHMMLEYITINK